MPYLYGIADTKFRVTKTVIKKKSTDYPPVKFRKNAVLEGPLKFDHNAWPIQFRVSPASLVEQCCNVVDKLPLPSIYEWTDMDIRRWICRYGYPQYMNTFRVNMIWGKKLLLLDADALSAMNITDFEHIKHITYGIRMLFHFELTRFSRNMSLPDEKPNELYLLWHTQSGVNYDAVRRSDLYRRMQLIRERELNLDHWDMLDVWLHRELDRKYKELIAFVPRHNMYRCPAEPLSLMVSDEVPSMEDQICHMCIPPCECNWTERDKSLPWRLSYLQQSVTQMNSKWMASENLCAECIPPCECRWPSRYYLTGTVFRCLQHKFPEKFAPIFDERITTVIRPSGGALDTFLNIAYTHTHTYTYIYTFICMHIFIIYIYAYI
ncbi:GH11189 [Drosophila grimshawi]|uniref:GH11189 n=1 Tax=Drosophila grimshawi TaxID=7222 RepID=B4JDH9_DROGR|nr:GH11189 [Drosophila grimshawi]